MTIHCRLCGKARTGPPSKVKKLIYCSPECARKMRHETEPERLVREALQSAGISFIAEHTIHIYSLDFFLPSLNLDIEVDGEYWHQSKEVQIKDIVRDFRLKQCGITTLRLPSLRVKKMSSEEIIRIILNAPVTAT
jgi:very-short-patch-repair endonuclease